jgi:AcrR family transcriptional regulator
MPRDTLTREKIIAAAVDLLDTDGLEGLNVRALGRRLGSAATAIYWHVGSKDNLVALAADQAWNEIALPDPDAAGWRDAASAMAAGLHAMLLRHPWLLQAFGSFLVFGPGKARHDDHTLAIYEAAGFSGVRADQAAATVFTFVLGHALGAAADASLTRKLSREGGNAEELIRDHVARATELAAQFPRLGARLGAPPDDAATGYGAAPEGSFDFGLRAILDGLAAQLAEAAPHPAGAPAKPGPGTPRLRSRRLNTRIDQVRPSRPSPPLQPSATSQLHPTGVPSSRPRSVSIIGLNGWYCAK